MRILVISIAVAIVLCGCPIPEGPVSFAHMMVGDQFVIQDGSGNLVYEVVYTKIDYCYQGETPNASYGGNGQLVHFDRDYPCYITKRI
jgi:hypothetical protein